MCCVSRLNRNADVKSLTFSTQTLVTSRALSADERQPQRQLLPSPAVNINREIQFWNYFIPPNLNCVASLGGDALHGQDNLEGVLPNVPGTHTAIITFNRVTIMVRLWICIWFSENGGYQAYFGGSHLFHFLWGKIKNFLQKGFQWLISLGGKKHYSSIQHLTCTEVTSRLSCDWPQLARTSGRSPETRQSPLQSPWTPSDKESPATLIRSFPLGQLLLIRPWHLLLLLFYIRLSLNCIRFLLFLQFAQLRFDRLSWVHKETSVGWADF